MIEVKIETQPKAVAENPYSCRQLWVPLWFMCSL